MAFFTYSELASELPNIDSLFATRELVKIEAKLLSYGFIFNTPANTTHTLKPSNGYSQRLFDLQFMSEIAGVSLFRAGNLSRTLNQETDYTLTSHPNIIGYSVRLNLNTDICEPYYLQLTAKKGLYINTTASDNIEVKLLKSGIVDYLSRLSNIKESGYSEIKRSKTGGSEIEFMEGEETVNINSIIEDNIFVNSVLSFFLC